MRLKKVKKVLAESYVFLLEQVINFKSKNRKRIGVTKKKRDIPIVVSLTSIPERLDKVHLTIETLLEQSIKPDYITLWLGREITSLPERIKRLEKRGIQVYYRKDIGPFKKEIYALREFPDSVLVTADDDLLYPQDWLENLYYSYLKDPGTIHCHMSRLMRIDHLGNLAPYRSWPVNHGFTVSSLLIFPLTGSGTLFPPGSLHTDVVRDELFLKMCPTADDIWMKSMSLLKRTPCKTVVASSKNIFGIRGSQSTQLYIINRSKNDEYISNVFNYYDIARVLSECLQATTNQ